MRSKIYQELYPDELMLQYFGTLSPSVSEKSEFYHTNWQNWEANAMYYDNELYNEHEIKYRLKSLGLRDIFDFQVRRIQVRFRSASDLAMAKLSDLEKPLRS